MAWISNLTEFDIDDGAHNMDGLRLFAQDRADRIEAFISRKVMDIWVESIEHRGDGRVCSATNTMHWASAILRRSSGSSSQNISAVRLSIASIPLSMCCSRISRKAARRWT